MSNYPEGNMYPDDPRSPWFKDKMLNCKGCGELWGKSEMDEGFCIDCCPQCFVCGAFKAPYKFDELSEECKECDK